MALARGVKGAPALLSSTCALLQHNFAAALGRREFSSDLDDLALVNKGLRAGPGGRSSVSGITATVFGCSGFLGRYVVNTLAQHGSQVVVPYRCDELDIQHLRPMGDLGQIVQYPNFSIRNEDQIREAVSRSNVIVNLIGAEQETPRFRFEEVHIEAAERIAKVAAESGLTERLLHVSCLGASETAPSRRLRTKALGEKKVLEHFPLATIFKPSVMVGVEDRLFNTIAQMSKTWPLVPLWDGGETKLQPVWVRDVAGAVVASLKRKDARGKTYYLAGPDVFTFRELVELTFDTIRERNKALYIPSSVGKLLAKPREWLIKKGVPFPVNTLWMEDFIDEMHQDYVLPKGVPTFEDLGIEPRRISLGIPIEHVRYFRTGGYEHGKTAGTEGTGGSFF